MSCGHADVFMLTYLDAYLVRCSKCVLRGGRYNGSRVYGTIMMTSNSNSNSHMHHVAAVGHFKGSFTCYPHDSQLALPYL